MDDRAQEVLRFVGAQLVFVAALVHLALGVTQWLRWLQAGFLLPRDARWPVFVASALAVFAGMYLARRAENRRPYYAAGVVVMLGYAVAYFGWHFTGHRPLILFGPSPGTESITVQWFLDHLFAGPVEFLSVVVEVGAAAVLAVLLVVEE